MKQNKLVIFQAKDGAIELKPDYGKETIWANLDQLVDIFEIDKSGISRHIKNILKTRELRENSVVAKNATTGSDGKTYNVTYYNLDMIISVGYRVNSKTATKFRIWATKTLKQHITKGFTVNKNRIEYNYKEFLDTIEDIKLLAKNKLQSDDILELVKAFTDTWFSIGSYDEQKFPKKGFTKQSVIVHATDLYKDVDKFKKALITKNQATEFFAQEKHKDALEGILGNVLQATFGTDVYPSIEEKSAHLLYFVIKNHPFTDGNKRTGAFSFIWFLRKANFNFQNIITPETLTALTLLIAESNPKDKEKMIGIVLLLLNTTK